MLAAFLLRKVEFQCGAIGRVPSASPDKAPYDVSIPVWCDWKIYEGDILSDWNEFQFQYGAIGRVLNLTLETSSFAFQFQYGAIGRMSACPIKSMIK